MVSIRDVWIRSIPIPIGKGNALDGIAAQSCIKLSDLVSSRVTTEYSVIVRVRISNLDTGPDAK